VRKPPELFKALAVDTRVKIVELLKTRGPLGSSEIAEALGVTPSAISQHLKVLRHAGLVRNERKGYWIPHSIDVEAMDECRRSLAKVCNCGCMPRCHASTGGSDTRKDGLEALRERERELVAELREVRAEMKRLRGRR